MAASRIEARSLAQEGGARGEEARISHDLGTVAQARENLVVAEEHIEAAVLFVRESEFTGNAFDGSLI